MLLETSILISAGTGPGSFLSGTETLLSEEPALQADGWDVLTRTTAIAQHSLTAEALAALHPIGERLGTRTWWLTAATPTHAAPGVWVIELTYKGWAAKKPVKSYPQSSFTTVTTTVDVPERAAVPAYPGFSGFVDGSPNIHISTPPHDGSPAIPAHTRNVSFPVPTASIGYTFFVEDAATLNNMGQIISTGLYPTGVTLPARFSARPAIAQDILPGTSAAMVTITFSLTESDFS
jgi:hypothetical protein